MALAVIETKNIRLAVLQQPFPGQQHPPLQPGSRHHSTADHLDFDSTVVPNVVGPIIGHVQVERPVAVNIRQRQGCASERGFRPRCGSRVGERPFV